MNGFGNKQHLTVKSANGEDIFYSKAKIWLFKSPRDPLDFLSTLQIVGEESERWVFQCELGDVK